MKNTVYFKRNYNSVYETCNEDTYLVAYIMKYHCQETMKKLVFQAIY